MTAKTLFFDRPLTVIADENIAGLDEYFARHQNIRLIKMNGRTITDNVWQHKPHALFIRSVTPINETTLPANVCHNLRFVGTATIGTDHIDQSHLAKHNIAFASAQGSSKHSVAQYVITAILTLRPNSITSPLRLGIIGLGNIGKTLAFYAKQLGWQVVGYDPFLSKSADNCHNLTQTLQSDVVSIHTPLTYPKDSPYPTFAMVNDDFLAHLPTHTLLINTARGQLIDEQTLLNDISKSARQVVLDVFPNEPIIGKPLLSATTLATPHIAGYTLEGKWCGTDMIYRAFCQHVGLIATHRLEQFLPDNLYRFGDLVNALKKGDDNVLSHFYDIKADDTRLRTSAYQDGITKEGFDLLRKNYPLRRQWLP